MSLDEWMRLGAALQNSGGLMLVLGFLVVKVNTIEKMVCRHNDMLFPKRDVSFHDRKDDKK